METIATTASKHPPLRGQIRWASPRVLLIEYAGVMSADARYVRQTEERVRSASGRVGRCYELKDFKSFDHA